MSNAPTTRKNASVSYSSALPSHVQEACAQCDAKSDGTAVLIGIFKSDDGGGYISDAKGVKPGSKFGVHVYIAPSQVERFRLTSGSRTTVLARPPRSNEKGSNWAALKVLEVGDNEAGQARETETVSKQSVASSGPLEHGHAVLSGVLTELLLADSGSQFGFISEARGKSKVVEKVYLGPAQVERFKLSVGDFLKVLARPPRHPGETAWAALRILGEGDPEGSRSGDTVAQGAADVSSVCDLWDNDHFPSLVSSPQLDASQAQVEEISRIIVPPASNEGSSDSEETCRRSDHLAPLASSSELESSQARMGEVGRPSTPLLPSTRNESSSSSAQDCGDCSHLHQRIMQLEAELSVLKPRDGPLSYPFLAKCINGYQAPESGYLSLEVQASVHVTHIETQWKERRAHFDGVTNKFEPFLWFYGFEWEGNVKGSGWFPAHCVARVS